MHERIDHGAILLKNNVFQFDFLNDDFSKLPQPLQDIINDEEKRKKLVVYINPPYAEAASMGTVTKSGANKNDVAVTTMVYEKYKNTIGIGGRELFVQFFTRIYAQIPNCVIAEFSTLKILQAPNFSDFRNFFKASLEKFFVVPADTFDNVKGKFPIGFFIWNTGIKEKFEELESDIYDSKGNFIGNKKFINTSNEKSINDWLITTRNRTNETNIGFLSAKGNDFQNVNFIFIINDKSQLPHPRGTWITDKNIIEVSIYLSVRHCIKATWLNDRDQFVYPNANWQTDTEFQNDCLAFTLFDNSNNITSSEGTNHWIPFTEYEVNAQAKFESNFMTNFIKGKIKQEVTTTDLFSTSCQPELVSGSNEMLKQVQHDTNIGVRNDKPLVFSEEATAVFDAGRELWKYYHAQNGVNVNASLYDIREYFQGRNDKGRMNSKSDDATYTKLIAELRSKLAILADKIKPKVYEYGFLKE